MYAGIDSTLHLTETCENPRKVVPRALMTTVVVGLVTGFGFSVAMCYGITDLSALVNTRYVSMTFILTEANLTLRNSMPIYDIWRQTTKSSVAATAFLVALLLIILFVIVAMQQTAGCLTWSLARDDALLFSKKFGIMHPRLGVPAWALAVNAALIFLAGCVYLISSTAFSALINSSIILQIVSFAMPCALLMMRGRSEHVLPSDRAFSVPSWLGWVANAVVVVAAIIETIFFDFPAALPISVSSMSKSKAIRQSLEPGILRMVADQVPDYTCVVLAALAMLSCINWFAHGRRSYQGPTLQMQG
jgi:choline transport protein